ncbi:MAG: hypothetical protein U1E65_02000 [Myxococcota bacterium]
MAKREFALEAGGPKRLCLRWKGLWKEIQLELDGKVVGTIAGQAELKNGKSFTLPDGSAVHVQLVTGFGSAELQVTKNGDPLPGSGGHPEERLRQAVNVIFFIAALSGLLGLLAVVFDVAFLVNLGIGVGSVVMGVLFLALGFAVKSTRSAIALGIALVLFILDGLASLVMSLGASGTPPIGGLVARVFLVIPMIKGFGAIRELKQQPLDTGVGTHAASDAKGQPWEPPER